MIRRLRFINYQNLTILYFVCGILWILSTDFLVSSSAQAVSNETPFAIHSFKGLLFISVSSLFFYSVSKKATTVQRKLSEVMQLGLMGTFEIEVNNGRVLLSEEAATIYNIAHRVTTIDQILSRLNAAEAAEVRKTLSSKLEHGTIYNFIHELHLSPGLTKHVNASFRIKRVKGNSFVVKGILQDITRLKELENKLNKSYIEKNRLDIILENIRTMVVITDSERKISWVNRAFENKLGYSSDEVIGLWPADILYGEKTSANMLTKIEEAVKQKKHFTVEYDLYKKSGETITVKIKGSPLKNDEGELQGYIILADDITESKEKETQIKNQNLFLKEITYLTSHEIRRPVASIMALVPLLEAADNPAESTECLDMLLTSAKELDLIVREVNQKISKFECH